MNELASWALNTAALRGASYADVRLGDDRSRALSSKNGKVGSASVAESHGFGVRVIADGAWGFAASDDLSRAGVEATAAERWRSPIRGHRPVLFHQAPMTLGAVLFLAASRAGQRFPAALIVPPTLSQKNAERAGYPGCLLFFSSHQVVAANCKLFATENSTQILTPK